MALKSQSLCEEPKACIKSDYAISYAVSCVVKLRVLQTYVPLYKCPLYKDTLSWPCLTCRE